MVLSHLKLEREQTTSKEPNPKLDKMADKLTTEKVAEYKAAFDMFDVDGDGTISSEELGNVLKCLGQTPTEEELKKIISDLDADGDGDLGFPEFISMMQNMVGEDMAADDDKLRQCFQTFDKDNSGFISKEELSQAFSMMGQSMSHAEINELFEEADSDGDGNIDFEEFKALMRDSS